MGVDPPDAGAAAVRDAGQAAAGGFDEAVGEGGVGASGGEQGVLGFPDRLLDQGAEVGRGGETQLEAAVDGRHRQTGTLEIRVGGQGAVGLARAVGRVRVCGGVCLSLRAGIVEEVVAGQAPA